MFQQVEPDKQSSYFLAPQEFKAEFQSQHQDQTISKDVRYIVDLKNNLILIYMFNGEYLCYSMLTQQTVVQGMIESNLRRLFYIDESLVAFLSCEEKKLKILDLKQNIVLDAFGPQMPTLTVLPKELRTDQAIQSILNDTLIICLPGTSSQTHYNLLVYENKASYSSNFEVVYSVFQFPKNILDLTTAFDSIKFQCQYQNVTEQRQMYGSLLDEDTAAFYGSDFEANQYEFTLCRPKLGKMFMNIVYIPEPLSFVLMQITPWEKGHLGIWLNNNDSSGQTCVDILNYENYFDVADLNIQQIKNLYSANRVPLIFDNDVENSNPGDAILREVNFVGRDYSLIERIIGSSSITLIMKKNTSN